MPKRIIDGEGLWGSDRLGTVEPEWVRPEYANLIPLALSNGVFECSVRRVWRDVYGFNRPSMTEKKVAIVLESLAAAKLLFRFEDGGKTWGYWVGIDKPGRLPSFERRGRNEKAGPTPPQAQLSAFLMDTNGIHASRYSDDTRTQTETYARAGGGSGFGLGFGLGVGNGSAGRGDDPTPDPFAVFWKAYPNKRDRQDASRAFAKLSPDAELQAAILAAIERQKRSDQWRRDGGAFIPHASTWLNKRRWEDGGIEGIAPLGPDRRADAAARVGAPSSTPEPVPPRKREWLRLMSLKGREAANAAVPEYAQPAPQPERIEATQ